MPIDKKTTADYLRRKNLLPGGIGSLVELLAKANGGVSPLNKSAIGMVLRGERGDYHGVQELFIAVTNKEQKRRDEQAKELAKQLEP